MAGPYFFGPVYLYKETLADGHAAWVLRLGGLREYNGRYTFIADLEMQQAKIGEEEAAKIMAADYLHASLKSTLAKLERDTRG